MTEVPKYVLLADALGDVKAMHLLRAQVEEGQTPFEDLSRDLNLLSSPAFPINEWWKSFDRLKAAKLIEVKDIGQMVIVMSSEAGKQTIAHEKRRWDEGR